MPSKIEWTEETWNPITGCSHSGSPGCDHCYAKRMAQRLKGRYGYPEDDPFRVTWQGDRIIPSKGYSVLEEPLHWKNSRNIFVCSMGDLFHDDVDIRWMYQVMNNIYTAKHHTIINLTKRPKNMLEYFNGY